MTKFLNKTFTVHTGVGQTYRDNWDATFGKKQATPTPGVALDRHERCEYCGEGHMANCPRHEWAPGSSVEWRTEVVRALAEGMGMSVPGVERWFNGSGQPHEAMRPSILARLAHREKAAATDSSCKEKEPEHCVCSDPQVWQRISGEDYCIRCHLPPTSGPEPSQ